MKTNYIFITIAAALFIIAAGCKPTEQNYRTAYEAAKEKQNLSGGVDSTIYSMMRPQGKGSVLAAGTDSLRMHTVTIGYTKDGGATSETVHRYNVVVGQFKQIFNAKAMRQRLMDNGYPDAMIVHTREPLYYVISQSCATPEEAAKALHQVEKDQSIKLRDPFPWILRPSHLAR